MSTTTTTTAGDDLKADGGASSGNTMYIIVGAAAGGSVSALVALTLLAIKRMRSPPSSTYRQATLAGHTATIGGDVVENGQFRFKLNGGPSSEIYLMKDDLEVSTLGDPVAGMMTTAVTEPDEQTASVENDYDYTKQYLRSQGIVSLDSAERISSDTSIELQFEGGNHSSSFTKARFEVLVPPGKLGMVIDTPNGGVPVVHAIKPDSALASQVMVGDRLLLVDGDDVTIMTAMQVSQLISLKSDQHRMLVFMRGGIVANNSNIDVESTTTNDRPPTVTSVDT